MNLELIIISLIILSTFAVILFTRRANKNDPQLTLIELLRNQEREQNAQRQRFDEHQVKSLTIIQDSLSKAMSEVREQISTTLRQHTENIGYRVDKLTEETQTHLKEISGQVDKRLTEGFEKTNATFIDVVKRLSIIDEAQKKITELSGSVVSLQEILVDKRSRGAFGEVQLSALVRNMLPEQHFSLQHSLSNGTRVDCILFLPEPSGNVAIDSKFPLESFQKIINVKTSEAELKIAQSQFKQDVKKHILDIASKYIIANETADGAMMFIPAEAIFAEIHGNHPELVEFAHKNRVWLVSPTTMMAILTTARAVLKDAATRKQVHIIQEHLGMLAKDFERFQVRMNKLKEHIGQVHADAELVHKSSEKISSRFEKIEKVELPEDEKPALLEHG